MKSSSLAGLSDAANKRSRLKTILDSWDQNPGRAPGGTGTTGLLSTDKEGYSQMLNEQQEALNLEDQLGGKAPLQVKEAPMRELHFDSNGYVPNGNPAYEEANFQTPYSVDQIRRKGSLQGLQRLVG